MKYLKENVLKSLDTLTFVESKDAKDGRLKGPIRIVNSTGTNYWRRFGCWHRCNLYSFKEVKENLFIY